MINAASQVKPRGTRALVKIDRSARTFAGGTMVIAEAPREDGHEKVYPQVARVVSASGEVTDVSVGDKVIMTKHNGIPVPGLKDVKIIKEEFILAIVSDDADLTVEWGGRGK